MSEQQQNLSNIIQNCSAQIVCAGLAAVGTVMVDYYGQELPVPVCDYCGWYLTSKQEDAKIETQGPCALYK